MDGIVPAVIVVSRCTVPAARIVFQGRVVPLVAGVLSGDDYILPAEASIPDFGRPHFHQVPFDTGFMLLELIWGRIGW
jgi:hypothetical protein